MTWTKPVFLFLSGTLLLRGILRLRHLRLLLLHGLRLLDDLAL